MSLLIDLKSRKLPISVGNKALNLAGFMALVFEFLKASHATGKPIIGT